MLHPANMPGVVFTQVQLLKQAFAGRSRKLIISSSWRLHYPLEELKQRLPEGLVHRVVSRTGPALAVKHAHYQEIKAYLDQIRKTLANWRSLDDAVLRFPKFFEELNLCNPNTGMTKRILVGELFVPYSISKWSPRDKSFKALLNNHSIGKYKKVAPTF